MKRTVEFVLALLLALSLLGSCGSKEDPVEETLSLDKEQIDAPKEMASYKIAISSNASWTVSFTDANGKDVSWGALDRSSGSGDASITLRLYENKNKSSRSANLIAKTKGGVTASATVTQEGNSDSDHEVVTAKLRIGTYNIRASWVEESNAQNDWSVRKERLRQSIIECAFDIFGLQEVSAEQQSWLTSTFGDTYSFSFFSPYSQSGTGDRGQGIAWRTSDFTMSGWHYFWVGNDPATMSTNDYGSNGNFKRGGCCCVLTHKATGLRLFMMNTHGCLNEECRIAYAPQFESMEKLYNADGLPSFFVGDMNAAESTEEGSPYKVYSSYWSDSYKAVAANRRSGSVNTYNGYSSTTGKSRIDMIFFRGGNPIVIDTYTCKNILYGGLFASDHFPVYVDAVVTY